MIILEMIAIDDEAGLNALRKELRGKFGRWRLVLFPLLPVSSTLAHSWALTILEKNNRVSRYDSLCDNEESQVERN